MKVGNYKNKNRVSSSGQGRAPSRLPGALDSVNVRKRYFTTSQLMTRWGVSAPTVHRLIDEGALKGLKIRGVYRVDRASIEIYEKKVAF
ncbi:MAG: helix-turn-helix domain-containing protein [Nitrospinae bacterium]|nr:helix-turn-helix domain-containing protein [Nitrospinota bacterium]